MTTFRKIYISLVLANILLSVYNAIYNFHTGWVCSAGGWIVVLTEIARYENINS